MATIKTVRTAAAVLLALGCLKYLVLLADVGFEVSQSPVGFLLMFTVPVGLVLWLLPRHPRAALVLMVLVSVLLLVFLVGNVVQNGFAKQVWVDYLVVYLGGPVAAVGLIAAMRCLTGRQRLA